MQVAHPLVAAGVDQHSDFRDDPVGRLRRTLDTTLAVVFGDDAAVRRAIDRMNRIHRDVRGTADSGRRYSARDPRLLLWVQATLVLTSLRLYELVMGPLSSAEREAYWEETKPIAVLLGVPHEALPGTVADLEAFEREVLTLEALPDAAAGRVGRQVLRPLSWLPEALYWPSDALAASLLPRSLREMYGLRYGLPERLFARGVLVAVGWLRLILPERLTVVPQARRHEARVR
jgi:uncharacterized protein (DUF2236 family)